jgi:membrane carboxypeptidase/penicillin-binding protein PbpC
MEAPHLVDHLLAQPERLGAWERHVAEPSSDGEKHLPSAESRNHPWQVRTTLDLDLQHQVESALRAHRTRLEAAGTTQAAAVVLDNRDVTVAALAGSIEYSARYGGFNNGATALRSPGSALKPFLYAQALDAGFTAATVLEDTERPYPLAGASYRPANYDRESYGPVMMREALANSFNLSAVYLLNRIGCDDFFRVLKRLDLINFPERGPDHYGLGMVVGNPEVTPLQLATAYAALANGGVHRPARFLADAPEPRAARVFSEEASAIVLDILADPTSRALSFGGSAGMDFPWPVSVKTGTSTQYRDAWTVAITPLHTVAVWVGNFDGSPTRRFSGASGASPILADLLKVIYRATAPPRFRLPDGVSEGPVCSLSGMKPGPHCPHLKPELFAAGTEPSRTCNFHKRSPRVHDLPARFADWLYDRYRRGAAGRYRLAGFDGALVETFGTAGRQPRAERGKGFETNSGDAGRRAKRKTQRTGGSGRGAVTITPARPNADSSTAARTSIQIVSPLAGEHFVIDRWSRERSIVLQAVADSPAPEVTWYVDGVEFARTGPPYAVEWTLRRGRHTLTVAAGTGGYGDSVTVMVE